MTIIEALDLMTENPMEGAVAFLNVICSGKTPEQNLVFDALLSLINNDPTSRIYIINANDCKEMFSIKKKIVIDSVFSREDDMDLRCLINVDYVYGDEVESIKMPWCYCFHREYDTEEITVMPTDLFKNLVILSSIASYVAR